MCVKKKLSLSSEVRLSSAGDGTVIADTALMGDGSNYYLNLGEYNQDNKITANKSHSNMFEVPSLFEIIHNILKKDSNLPLYVTTTEPSKIDFTVIKMHSPVDIDVYDGEGLHTGMVENDDEDEEYIEENRPALKNVEK